MRKKLVCWIAIAIAIVLAVFCVYQYVLTPASPYKSDRQSGSLIPEITAQIKEVTCSLTDVTIEVDSAYVDENNPIQLTATISCPIPHFISAEDSDISWSSSNHSIVEVNRNGLIQARGSGDAIVTATLPNGNSSSCIVSAYANPYDGAAAIPVLTYHRVASDFAKENHYSDNNLAIAERNFEEQMNWLDENGYTTVSSWELHEWMDGRLFLPEKSIMLTFDDGFYETYHVAYPILRKHNFKGCAFVIGSNISDKTDAYDPADKENHFMGQDVIDELRKEYPELEIQSHTYDLHKRTAETAGIAMNMTESELKIDLDLNRKYDFTALAYPFGHVNWTFRNALQADPNIQMAFGYPMTYPVTRDSDIYILPRYKVFGDGTLDDFIMMASSGW